MTIKQILQYINYRITSFDEHDLHSPFLYNFYTELILNKIPFNDFEFLTKIRAEVLKDTTELLITDFGAGSKKLKSNKRRVCDIAKHGIAQKKQAEFLFRLVNKFNPKIIVELGTSVGLTTMYLAKPSSKSKVYTIEGSDSLTDFAQKLASKNQINNVEFIHGNFNDKLPQLLNSIESIDLFYVDGNHAYEPTINYFKIALTKKHKDSIFIFDDINWSSGMQKAWNEIVNHPEVRLSLDFYHFGIVFFRTENKEKEHFVLKF